MPVLEIPPTEIEMLSAVYDGFTGHVWLSFFGVTFQVRCPEPRTGHLVQWPRLFAVVFDSLHLPARFLAFACICCPSMVQLVAQEDICNLIAILPK